MKSFSDFLGKHNRDQQRKLKILGKLLEKADFKVKNHLDNDVEAYIFIHKPLEIDPTLEDVDFEGVRIYIRGKDTICYRVQNAEDTEPYGNAYMLDLKGVFHDILGETTKREKIAHELVHYMIQNLKNFFIKSAKSMADDPAHDDDPMGAAVVNASGTDYANTVK